MSRYPDGMHYSYLDDRPLSQDDEHNYSVLYEFYKEVTATIKSAVITAYTCGVANPDCLIEMAEGMAETLEKYNDDAYKAARELDEPTLPNVKQLVLNLIEQQEQKNG